MLEVCNGKVNGCDHPAIAFDEENWAKAGEYRCPLCRLLIYHQNKCGDTDYNDLRNYLREDRD